VIDFTRSEDNLLGKLAEFREIFTSFAFKGKILAGAIEFLTQNIPHLKVIVTGISSGAGYANEVMKLLSQKDQVYALEAGLPFPYGEVETENILILNNEEDALAQGDKWQLACAYLSAPFKWIASKLRGEDKSLAWCVETPGHDYEWERPYVSPRIIAFLEEVVRDGREGSAGL